MGWIGVDLDGTLAHYESWKGTDQIGEPVPAMLARVHKWIEQGKEVRIFTARASVSEALPYIENWCQIHVGRTLPITNVKDFGMIELWDDRAVRVAMNTGEPCCNYEE